MLRTMYVQGMNYREIYYCTPVQYHSKADLVLTKRGSYFTEAIGSMPARKKQRHRHYGSLYWGD